MKKCDSNAAPAGGDNVKDYPVELKYVYSINKQFHLDI
jgi:hypothetical protein